MGCCESSPVIDDFLSSYVTPVERMTFDNIICQIPVHCRQEIINLPVQPFLRIYQYHLDAIWFIARNEFLLAILRELQAIEGLRTLLSPCKDHFIFSDFYTILSASFIRSGNIESAIGTAQISLIILVKHTPTDHKNISMTYATLALYHRLAKESRAAELCAMKAIERARLTNELIQQDISTLEEILELTKQESNDSVRLEMTVRELQPNPGENQKDFLRRTRAEMIAHNAANGTLPFDKAECERLPNKETESQIDEEILNDILQVLENYLGKDEFLYKFGTKCDGLTFIAAQFKNTQMKTSSLSPAMIEAALTIIIKQMNDEHTGDNERYAVVKQSPFTISYTDDDELNMKGVRVFQVTAKNPTN